MTRRGLLRAAGALFLLVSLPSAAAQYRNAAVAAAHPLAEAAAERILSAGGNAFDAAIATAATLAVVEPFGSGLGGGGFFLLHRARDDRDLFVDARETAPLAIRREMLLDENGVQRARSTLSGGLASGIPGTVAGLEYIARRFGRLPLATSLAPAIRHARSGLPVDARYGEMVRQNLDKLRADAAAAGIFLDRGEVPEPGWVLRQPALARTLAGIARSGAGAFYRGRVAREMVSAVRRAGGVWSAADLAGYRIRARTPVRFRFRDARIVTAPLPSAGGIALAQALYVLDRLGYGEAGEAGEAGRMHFVAMTLARVYRDRARYLGDPDFVPAVPALAATPYLDAVAAEIQAGAAVRRGGERKIPGDGNTTHFSIVDRAGNRVSATLTLNTFFGSGLVAGDSGVLLNDEMDDFAVVEGKANVYGLPGGTPNLVGPGKRPLSSMTPTFVEDSRGVLVLGTPGGSRIVSMVLNAILDYLDSGDVDVARIVGRPRFHHQGIPEWTEVEPDGFAAGTLAALEALGHEVLVRPRPFGNMQVVFADAGTREVRAANDPRGRPRSRAARIPAPDAQAKP